MNKYATLDEDVADVAGDEPSIQKEGRGFEIAAGQVRIPKSTGVSVCSISVLFLDGKYFEVFA